MAGGTFYVGEKKIRPGNYHREESDSAVSTASNLNGVGAGLIRAAWGPLNEAVEFDTTTKVSAVYGSGYTEDLITEMFNGGITSGYFVRIGNDDGTAPTITLYDTEGNEAVTITGAYVGDMEFTATVRDSLTNSKQRQLIIYVGTTVFASVTFTKATDDNGVDEAQELVDAINDELTDFIAVYAGDATLTDEDGETLTDEDGDTLADSESSNGILAEVTQQAFTAGTQPTVTVDSYSNGLDVLEAYEWNCMAVDTEDLYVHELIGPWLNQIYAAGMFPMACIAECGYGDNKVSLDERMARAAAYNNKMLCYVLNPAYSTSGKLYDGYRNAARIAGMIAAVETTTSLTGDVVEGYAKLAEPLTNTQIETALTSGCIALTMNKQKQVVIEQGINTLVTPDDDEDEGWKKIRRVKVRYELIRRIMLTLERLHVDNTKQGRATIIAAAYEVYSEMVSEGKLFDGGTVTEDSSYKPTGDSAWFVVDCDDRDSLEKTYTTFRFRFAPET